MYFIKHIVCLGLVIALSSCAYTPQKLSESVQLPVDFPSVGYRDSYWEFGFDHIATLTIHHDRVELNDEDINMVIPFKNIMTIEYENPYHIEWNNYIIINYDSSGINKKAYFTSLKNAGWTPGSAKIYQVLIYSYESQRI